MATMTNVWPSFPLGEIAPDQDHGSARCDAKQDAAGQIAPPQGNLEHLDATHECDLPGPVFGAKRQIQSQRQLDQVDDLGTDELAKEHAEKHVGDGIHREWLDGPVDEERQSDGLHAFAGLDDLCKVDLHHDGVHHEEEADGYRNGDDRSAAYVESPAVECHGDLGSQLAQDDPDDDA